MSAHHEHTHHHDHHEHDAPVEKPESLVSISRARTGGVNGKQYWRSLEELSDTPEFRQFIENEFPSQASEFNDPIGRRNFLKVMGASLALAGVGGACAWQPREQIVPYVTQPEEIIPGKALMFATAMTLGGSAIGLLARSNEGRPTKIEGNPDHPASLGSTDIYAQASILTLYDPDRSRFITDRGDISTWSSFLSAIRTALDEERPRQGAGFRILTETVVSPTLAAQLRAILAEFPQARWYQYEPCSKNNARIASQLVFGQPVNTIYRFDQATRVLSLDADFLNAQKPENIRYSHDFVQARKAAPEKREMNRLYMIETTPTGTGAMADHRLGVRPSEVEAFARTVGQAVGANMGQFANGATYGAHADWVGAMVRDLQSARGACVVVAGDEQSPTVHALAHAINQSLGNIGRTVVYTDPVEAFPTDQVAGLRELVTDMNAGAVNLLAIIGGNPIYNAPADLNFHDALGKVRLRAHSSLYQDETSNFCQWHIPTTHYLEEWSDTRAFDGTASIVQPLIEPLYGGRSAHEFIGAFSAQPDGKGYDVVRKYWQGQTVAGGGDFETFWRRSLHDGIIANTALQPRATPTGGTAATTGNNAASNNATTNNAVAPGTTTSSAVATPSPVTSAQIAQSGNQSQTANSPAPATANSSAAATANATRSATGTQANPSANQPNLQSNLRQAVAPAPVEPRRDGIEVVFRPDPTVYDGRFANNGWLQELPKPLTKVTWDNVALLSTATARKIGIGDNEVGYRGGNIEAPMIEVKLNNRSVTLPVWIIPTHADDVVTVYLGYGRTRAGKVGDKAGFNTYEVRTTDAMWQTSNAEVKNAGKTFELASTQTHFNMEGRELIRSETFEDYIKHVDEPHGGGTGEHHSNPPDNMSLYPMWEYSEHKWAMTIDLNNCTGCNSCIIACQAENNIPVVGKEQVQRSREMHWLRVDAYYEGSTAEEATGPYFQPIPCMHCEQAPCEPVCPVAATVHSAEGTNDMVYNRCVGTRYCSNNCPYKVRRFNFLLYQDWNTPTYKLMRNPEVSVRSRGVMEKCTYCIQRIQWAKIEAAKEDRPVRDGEIVTACQAACPTDTIIFGNMNDPNAMVTKMKAQEKRNYNLLGELGTRPRTTYLTALRNPNKEMPGANVKPRSATGTEHHD